MFEALVFDRILPFPHLPWKQAGEHTTLQEPVLDWKNVDFEVVLNWVTENQNLTLFNLVIIEMRTNGRTDKEMPGRQKAWGFACRTGDAELVTLVM